MPKARAVCACGCGEEINPWCTWVPGHHLRVGGWNPMHDPENARRHTESLSGYSPSSETRRKISDSLRDYKHDEEFSRKMSEAHSDRTFSDEHLKNLSLAMRGVPKSEEHKQALSDSLAGKYCGEDSPNWKGGFQGSYGWGWGDIAYFIFLRDGFTCQKCGTTEFTRNNPMSCHHLDYDKENMEDDNLITLCRNCNSSVNGVDRKYWTNFFRSKVELLSIKSEQEVAA